MPSHTHTHTPYASMVTGVTSAMAAVGSSRRGRAVATALWKLIPRNGRIAHRHLPCRAEVCAVVTPWGVLMVCQLRRRALPRVVRSRNLCVATNPRCLATAQVVAANTRNSRVTTSVLTGVR